MFINFHCAKIKSDQVHLGDFCFFACWIFKFAQFPISNNLNDQVNQIYTKGFTDTFSPKNIQMNYEYEIQSVGLASNQFDTSI